MFETLARLGVLAQLQALHKVRGILRTRLDKRHLQAKTGKTAHGAEFGATSRGDRPQRVSGHDELLQHLRSKVRLPSNSIDGELVFERGEFIELLKDFLWLIAILDLDDDTGAILTVG